MDALDCLKQWVDECAALCQPDAIVWCNGSEEEKQTLTEEAVGKGILIKLNQEKLPGCYLHRSNPNDVARTEHLTYICTPTKEEAGPTNNWMAPDVARQTLGELYKGSMKGRTMYVIPYLLGPPNSEFAKAGIEITDSIYVVLNMRIMTRMGKVALDLLKLKPKQHFNKGLHAMLDCSPEHRYICHFPQDNTVWSIGSGYGGNALLAKKCYALRIASYLGREEGWLAEHMLVLGVDDPQGRTTYVAAAFPSQCGKTNFAMLQPPPRFKDWKIWTVGDDLAWLRPGSDGRLWAVNPEAGYFGVAPGTNEQTNSNAMACIAQDTIYTNVALTEDGDVWWEGKTHTPPQCKMWDWQGRPWTPESGIPAAHPNSRFTAPAMRNPALSIHASDPQGVPISAIIFGGRRATTVPLVVQSLNWTHGVLMGATLGSETTAAATGKVGILRRDPMAMLPFCGYNVGQYWAHWLRLRHKLTEPPKIFMVNWFQKRPQVGYLWPGYGENIRVLKWIIERCVGTVSAQESLVGWIPHEGDLDLSYLHIPPAWLKEVLAVDNDEWRKELELQGEWFDSLGGCVPPVLDHMRQALLGGITTAPPPSEQQQVV